jgi:hypothetical protein
MKPNFSLNSKHLTNWFYCNRENISTHIPTPLKLNCALCSRSILSILVLNTHLVPQTSFAHPSLLHPSHLLAWPGVDHEKVHTPTKQVS